MVRGVDRGMNTKTCAGRYGQGVPRGGGGANEHEDACRQMRGTHRHIGAQGRHKGVTHYRGTTGELQGSVARRTGSGRGDEEMH